MREKIKYLNKNFFIEKNDNLKHIQKSMYNNRDFTMKVRNEIIKYLNKGKFIDIGANIGIITVLIQDFYDEAIAIEPDPTNFELLELNLLENQLSNVIPINCACGHVCGKTSLYINNINDGDHRCLRIKNPDEKIFKNIINNIELKTIDNICEALNFIPDVIKIDTQGCEMNILNGAMNIRPVYIMEYWPYGLHECGYYGKNIIDWCKNNDYVCKQKLLELEDINYNKDWFTDITLIPKEKK